MAVPVCCGDECVFIQNKYWVCVWCDNFYQAKSWDTKECTDESDVRFHKKMERYFGVHNYGNKQLGEFWYYTVIDLE